jgi:alkylated DNA repair dioxygenase AlkB
MTRQLGLFDNPADAGLKQDYLGIQGLVYLPRLLAPEEQVRVLAEIDKMPWQDDLKRRVQHYGYKYNYEARTVNHSMYVGPLPPFAVDVAQHLMSHGLITEFPDQLIVNEYQPGQGISAHVDCEPCFKNTIVTVSLGSTYEMDFISLESGEVRSTLLEPGSALVLRDTGRYQWMHRIKARKSDHGIPRGRRVSLTYRNVILSSEEREKEPGSINGSNA